MAPFRLASHTTTIPLIKVVSQSTTIPVEGCQSSGICPFQAPAGRLHLIPCVTWVTVVDMGVDHILLQIDLSRHLSPSQKPVPGFYIRGEMPFDTPVTAGYGSSPLSSEESYTLG